MQPLLPHPTSKQRAGAYTLEAGIPNRNGAVLQLTYRLRGPLAHLQIPQTSTPQFEDGLWQHTCFELFVAQRETSAYHEVNFSPSGRWAIYGFADYRAGMSPGPADFAPSIAVRTGAAELALNVTVDLSGLSPEYTKSQLTVGLSAVIEHGDAALSYWALAHRDRKPDFHQRSSFTLSL